MENFFRLYLFDFKKYIKNKYIWFGMIIILIIFVYINNTYIFSYPNISEKTFNEYKNKEDFTMNQYSLDYLIPASDSNKYIYVVQKYCSSVKTFAQMTELESKKLYDYIINNKLNYNEIEKHVSSTINDKTNNYISIYEIHQNINLIPATYDEYINFINTQLEKENYTVYFARKFGDSFGIIFSFFSFILFPFIFDEDMKKNIYEILKTKKIKSCRFILGRSIGFGTVIILGGFIITTVINVLVCVNCALNNIYFNIFDIYLIYLYWIIPSIVFIEFFDVAFTILFKSGVPTIPLMFIYIFLGTMPAVTTDGRYELSQNIWNLLVRTSNNGSHLFNSINKSFEINVLYNRLFLIGLSIIFMYLSIAIYENNITINFFSKKMRKNNEKL